VLNFFQCHAHPLHAFDEAMQHFGMSRPALLHLFRRVGVTEMEARSGTLPPASRRWRRILQASGGPRSSASASAPESWHAFANSLERDLDAPSPMHEANRAPARSRGKRRRTDDSVDRSPQRPARSAVSDQSDAPHANLPSEWGFKGPRTSIGGGLQDPGTPTDADLVASSTLFVGQNAPPFAGTEDDFPAFDDEEMSWLMALFDTPRVP